MNRTLRRSRPKLEDPAYLDEEDDEIKNPYVITSNPFNGTTSYQSKSGFWFTISIMVPLVLLASLVSFLTGSYWFWLPFFAIVTFLAYIEYRSGRARAERYKRERKR